MRRREPEILQIHAKRRNDDIFDPLIAGGDALAVALRLPGRSDRRSLSGRRADRQRSEQPGQAGRRSGASSESVSRSISLSEIAHRRGTQCSDPTEIRGRLAGFDGAGALGAPKVGDAQTAHRRNAGVGTHMACRISPNLG